MRVFILCAGRCGSTTFIKACKHIKNYTSSHESLSRNYGQDRFNYPENHIEADNRLSWHLGHLDGIFGDKPLYVHLKREKEKVAQSYLKRFYYSGSIMAAFCDGIRMLQKEELSKEMQLQVCYDYIDTVDTNIIHFLSDKSNVLTIELENVKKDFPSFWKRVAAQGNLEEAMEEFEKKYNSSSKWNLSYPYRLKLMAIREWRYLVSYIKQNVIVDE